MLSPVIRRDPAELRDSSKHLCRNFPPPRSVGVLLRLPQAPHRLCRNLFSLNSTVPYRHLIAELAPISDIDALEWLNITSVFVVEVWL